MDKIKNITTSEFQLLNKKDISKIIKYWRKLGYNNGLVEPQLSNVSIAFQVVYNIFTSSINVKYSSETQMLAFPIVRRILQTVKEEMPIPIIVGNTMEILDKLEKDIKTDLFRDLNKIKDVTNIDAEAEFCSIFSDYYKLKL